ncbi:MAG: protein kinase [Planctomycetota bacterium]
MTTVAERLFEDLLVRERDPAAALEALCRQHPCHAEQLRALWRGYRRVVGMLGDPGTELAASGGDEAPGRYQVLGEIASGGMGRVLEVLDRDLRRKLAMKVLRDDLPDDPLRQARARSRLVNEAQVLGQLEHPGIVPIHEVGDDAEGRPFFTMQRVRGRALDAVFAEARAGRDGWSLTRAVTVVLRACEAVAHAHDRGVLHRDLKPSNVMVGAFGEVYVVDWGLAKVRGTTVEAVQTDRQDESDDVPDSPLLTMQGDVVGTPAYMAPEQAEGRVADVDERSDIYSIGAMLYHLLSGTAPYAGSSTTPRQVLDSVLNGSPEPLERIAPRRTPAELAAICARAMARDPSKRYATVVALADDLRAYLEDRVVQAHRTGPVVGCRKWVRRNKGLAMAIAAVVLGVAAVIVLQQRAHRDISRRAAALRRQVYDNDVAFAQIAQLRNDFSGMKALLARCPQELRGWEWRCLQREADTSDLTLPAGGAASIDAAGRTIATALQQKPTEIRLWNANTGELRGQVSVDVFPRRPVFSADGRRLYLPSNDGTLVVIDVAACVVESQHPCGGRGFDVSLSPDGRMMAIGSDGGWLELWASVDERVARLDRGLEGFPMTAWSADGSRLAAATRMIGSGDDRSSELRIYDVPAARLEHRLPGHRNWLHSVAMSPDGRFVASGGVDCRLLLWDLAAVSAPPRQLMATTYMPSVVWSDDGTRLLASCDGRIVVWDTGTWSVAQELTGLVGLVNDPQCIGSETVVACDGVETKLWRLGRLDRVTIAPSEHATGQLAVSPTEPLLALAPWAGQVELWSLDTRRRRRVTSIDSDRAVMQFSGDGRRLLLLDQQGWLRIWDVASDTLLAEVCAHRPHGGMVGCVVPMPDGRRALTTGWDGRVRMWDLDAMVPEWSIDCGLKGAWPPGAHRADVAPHGRLVAVGAGDGCLRLLATGTGTVVRELRVAGGEHRYDWPAFSPDGRVVVAALLGQPRQLVAWDVETGAELWRVPAHKDHKWPRFTPDGSRVLTATTAGGVAVRYAHDGSRVVALERASPSACQHMVLSADGETAVVLTDGQLRFWTAALR